MSARILYFGCWGSVGHFLWTPDGHHAHDAQPWGDKIDACLCSGTPDRCGRVPTSAQSEGAATLHHLGGWTALAFWDRSVDERGNSNSVFLARAILTEDEILAAARAAYPRIWARFGFQVRIQ